MLLFHDANDKDDNDEVVSGDSNGDGKNKNTPFLICLQFSAVAKNLMIEFCMCMVTITQGDVSIIKLVMIK